MDGMGIECNKSTEKLDKNLLERPGALEIFIPCGCTLTAKGQTVIPRRFPCNADNNKFLLTHILPTSWSNVTSLQMNPLHSHEHKIVFENFHEILDTKWNLRVPHLNISSAAGLLAVANEVHATMTRTQDLSDAYATYFSYHGDLLYLIWNAALSMGLLYTLYRIHNVAGFLNFIRLARGQQEKPFEIHHDYQLYKERLYVIITVFLVLFTLCLFCLIGSHMLELYKRIRRVNRSMRCIDVADATETDLREGEAILQLSNGRKFVLHVAPTSSSEPTPSPRASPEEVIPMAETDTL